MKPKMETANCIICKQTFQRRVGRGRKYCDAEKCQKIKNIKNTVAKFSDMKTGDPSEYYSDIKYHGAYMP